MNGGYNPSGATWIHWSSASLVKVPAVKTYEMSVSVEVGQFRTPNTAAWLNVRLQIEQLRDL